MRSLACLLVLGLASTAHADGGAERCAKADETPEIKFHVEYRDGVRVSVIDNPIMVCPHVPRPGVAYVVSARSINYEWESLTQEFLPRTLASVTKAPF